MAGAFYGLAFDNDAFEVDSAVSVAADQTVSLPAQTATVSVPVSASGNQTISVPSSSQTGDVDAGASQSITIALPSQSATATVRVSVDTSQTVPLPSQSAMLDVEGAWVANQTVPAPSQTATGTVIVQAKTGMDAAFSADAFQNNAFLVNSSTSKTVRVPTQVATLYIGPANFSGAGSVQVPSQAATGEILTLASGSIYVNVPMPTATAKVLVQGESSKTIQVPEQNAVSYNPTAFVQRRKIARRLALPPFIARSDRKPMTSRRLAP